MQRTMPRVILKAKPHYFLTFIYRCDIFFTVDNIGNPPNIEIECGSVNATGMRLKDPPPTLLETQAGTVSRTRIPSDPYSDPWQSRQGRPSDPYNDPRQSRHMPPFSPLDPSRNLRSDFDRYLRTDDMEADEGPYDDLAERMMRPYDDAADRMIPPIGQIPPLGGPLLPPRSRSPPLDPPPLSRAPAPRPREPQPQPDIRSWKINIPDTPAPAAPVDPVTPRQRANAPPRKVAPTAQAKTETKPRSVQRLGKGVVRQRIPNRKVAPSQKGPKKVVDERPPETDDPTVESSDTGA